ncbi:MAG: CPBP family intramembrane metalloprotease, partial [Rhodospirillaceae bacterium]|nr:CPBP family intramembrane metalloprotease [Rhodospirillaceae bacterium]
TSPLVIAAAAVIGSPLLQAVTGQSILYNLWLVALMIAVWVRMKLTRREVGLVLGDGPSYAVALLYVVVPIGIVALGAWAAGLIDLKDYSTTTAVRRVVLNALVTFALTMLSEDGLFRGALWGACERSGFSPAKTVIWTSVAFGLWHLAVPFIEADFNQPLIKVPQYVIGSTAFGFAMGLLRLRSGSIVVPSACHGLWNATVYTFFGYGPKSGLLGIPDPSVWDPERGYIGLALVIIAAGLMWVWVKPARAPAT